MDDAALECELAGHDPAVDELRLGFRGADMASMCRRCGALFYEGSVSDRDRQQGRRPRL